MPRFTGYSTGQTFKGEDVTAATSYAQLANRSEQPKGHGRGAHPVQGHTLRAAGLPGRMATNGSGTWTNEAGFSLSTPELYGDAMGKTQTQRTMICHSANKPAAMPPPPSEIHLGSHPSDFRTVTSMDYNGAAGERRAMHRPAESKDEIFRKEWSADFKSTARVMHGPKEQQLGRPARERAGQPLTTKPQYNIITGDISFQDSP
eukprot:CAMPEP_0177782096 /NCGR_PEP_ID=MMETSP0491_2-20121128/18248_1 /TAXON_ID=63592 /ORGANISM="Tetraselmis chuii, Strain PLY429" /LENGTH=203 /DNA_ID=CAMNT_0019302299 /DNA_START=42 /DNA_END=653 /DNA_ORIENTATION=-